MFKIMAGHGSLNIVDIASSLQEKKWNVTYMGIGNISKSCRKYVVFLKVYFVYCTQITQWNILNTHRVESAYNPSMPGDLYICGLAHITFDNIIVINHKFSIFKRELLTWFIGNISLPNFSQNMLSSNIHHKYSIACHIWSLQAWMG